MSLGKEAETLGCHAQKTPGEKIARGQPSAKERD